VAVRVELGRRGEEGTTEPDGVALLLVRDDVDVDTGGLWTRKWWGRAGSVAWPKDWRARRGKIGRWRKNRKGKQKRTLINDPEASSLDAILWSTIPFKSLCSLLPKWSNIVLPPERTMFE
jgi:hypothetical protein